MTNNRAVTGYMHPEYAQSLAEFGIPRELPTCKGWILQRQIPGFLYYDGMGCYPLFSCQDWTQLLVDLEDIGTNLISLSMVTDPFGEYDVAYLRRCFRDKVLPFKDHFVIDLRREMNTYVSDHHRRNARRGCKHVCVELCEDPEKRGSEWISLYSALIGKHNIAGLAALSPVALKKQLEVPGMVMFRATYGEATVGMILWYVQESRGYYHLGAYSDTGYELRASFALFWYAIEYFATAGIQWLDLGAGAGIRNSSAEDGLARFKRGWSTGTRTAYFCGRIFDRTRYLEVTRNKGALSSDYFPTYRSGEFA